MDRLRVLTRQVGGGRQDDGARHRAAPQACEGQAGQEFPPEKVAAMMAFNQIIQDSDKLVKDGTWPSASFFDIGIVTKHNMGPPASEEIVASIEDAASRGVLSTLERLPGPWREAKTMEARVAVVKDIFLAENQGYQVFYYAELQQKYGCSGLSSNIIVPHMSNTGMGSGMAINKFTPRVIIGDPEDAERISRLHVRKEGNFEPVLYDGVIATTDNDHWRDQRRHLAEAFLPVSSLAAILPTSLARAKLCAERLAARAEQGGAIDMSDFLLHEAQAQLQLALLGVSEEAMESTNEAVRAAFSGDLKVARAGVLTDAMKGLMKLAETDDSLSLPSDGRPVHGPLSRAVRTGEFAASTNYGNMLLILFAGHDTTGHTMTWLLFELARNLEVQRRLAREVDAFFEALGGRDPTYHDLAQLEFMDRCVTETLRMWPAVASGTFRQLQFDDAVRGPGGEMVALPKGTAVQIVNWSRHRNPELWGADVDCFNPDRAFAYGEVAHVGRPLAAVSPQSLRFSPFAHAPRSCLGRNFAQMEMRLIMCYLLRRFEFKLTSAHEALAGATLGVAPRVDEFRGVNFGTMGPMDEENKSTHWWGERHYCGLKLRAIERAGARAAARA